MQTNKAADGHASDDSGVVPDRDHRLPLLNARHVLPVPCLDAHAKMRTMTLKKRHITDFAHAASAQRISLSFMPILLTTLFIIPAWCQRLCNLVCEVP